jgi:hypothetical protein
VQFDLGLQGLAILVLIALLFGVVAQLLLGRRADTHWLWLIGAAGWFIGGLFASEVVWATATVKDLQPIIDGLAFDEALLGGAIGGLVAVGLALLVRRTSTTHRPTPQP